MLDLEDTMCASTLRALLNLEIKNKIQTKKLLDYFHLAQCFPNKPSLKKLAFCVF